MTEQQNTTSLDDLRRKRKMTGHQAGGTTVAEFFKHNKNAMASVLPRHVDPERMLKVALHAVRSTPKLMECKLDSLMGSVMLCSQLGLEPNTPLGHAYLIPFKNNRKNITEVQVIIGYKGLIDLARRSGAVKSISAHAVREHDEYELDLGTEHRLRHVPKINGDRGQIIEFYAIAHFHDGGYQFERMSKAEVDAIKARSKAKNDGPWKTDYEPMGRKTVIRRLSNYLPLSIEFARANQLDGIAAAGHEQGLDRVLEGDYSVIDDPEAIGGDDDNETDTDHPKINPGELVKQIEEADDTETVTELMAYGAELQGQDKAKVTRAVNARIKQLTKPTAAAPQASAAGTTELE